MQHSLDSAKAFLIAVQALLSRTSSPMISSMPARVQPASPFVALVPLSNPMELTLEGCSTGSENDAEEGEWE